MNMFSHIKLTKEIKLLLFTFGIIGLLYFALPDYYDTLHVQAQLQQQQRLPPVISIKITSPVVNQVPVGKITISGISTDNETTDCTVYTDWNNTKPFQKATATGPGGGNDYSKWTFTYTDKYHLITNGTNNLTSKLSCFSDGSNSGTAANITKSYSINVIGVMEPSQRQVSSSGAAEQQNNLSGGISSSPLPPVMEYNNNTKTATTTTTSPESIPSVPITPSPSPSLPSIQEQKPEGNDNVVQKEEPQPQPAPRDNEDTTIYWDIQ